MDVIPCPDLAETIAFFTDKLDFRLDMIMPADSPRVAVVSREGIELRLEQIADEKPPESSERSTRALVCREEDSQWVAGRAGMEYRDLIPDRLGGRLIASHIRLTRGGEVADYVHYHKIGFQMIYCKAGRIRVVYQDQGPAFWLEPGDCVLQPPKIRHRVLEAEAGSEVIEVGCPAVHETWVDHEMKLPNLQLDPGRDYGGQRFVRHIAKDARGASSGKFEARDTGIGSATNRTADVRIVKNIRENAAGIEMKQRPQFYFVLAGILTLTNESEPTRKLSVNDSLTTVGPAAVEITADPQSEWLQVTLALDDLLNRPF